MVIYFPFFNQLFDVQLPSKMCITANQSTFCQRTKTKFPPEEHTWNATLWWEKSLKLVEISSFGCARKRTSWNISTRGLWLVLSSPVSCAWLKSLLLPGNPALPSWSIRHFSGHIFVVFSLQLMPMLSQCCFTVRIPQWQQWWDFKERVVLSFHCPLHVGLEF